MKLDVVFAIERRLGDPLVKISIDDYQTLYAGPAQEHNKFDCLVTPGPHVLKITHYGKKVSDHAYDEAGNVSIDKHIEIKSLSLDDIELHDELWEGEFFPRYWSHDSGPKSIKPNLYLGYNGTWQLEFIAPAAAWLVQLRKPGPKLEKTIFKSNQEILETAKDFFAGMPDV